MAPIKSDGNGGVIVKKSWLPWFSLVLALAGFFTAQAKDYITERELHAAERAATQKDIAELRQLVDRNSHMISGQNEKLIEILEAVSDVRARIETFHR